MLLFPALLVGPRGRPEARWSTPRGSQYEDQLNGDQIQSVVVNKRTVRCASLVAAMFAKYGKKRGRTTPDQGQARADRVPRRRRRSPNRAANARAANPLHRGRRADRVIAIVGGILYFNRRRRRLWTELV
jgi:hypothetical protein